MQDFLAELDQLPDDGTLKLDKEKFPFNIMHNGLLTDDCTISSKENQRKHLGLGPFGYPDVKEELLERMKVEPNLPRIPIEKAIKEKTDPLNFLNPTVTAPALKIIIKRNLITGLLDMDDFELVEESSVSAVSMSRKPNKPGELLGKTSNQPFLPGGMNPVQNDIENLNIEKDLDIDELEIVPPGFDRGLVFPGQKPPVFEDSDSLLLELLKKPEAEIKVERPTENHHSNATEPKDIDEFLPETDRVLTVSQKLKETKEREFAHMIDVNQPFPEFEQLVPELALEYPFELDVFQKRAIYYLEKGNSVFVAAHTSAGKTVIAEYAISMAQKHMTKAIYTSPIKALSNQKYRDFKQKFGDCGILTGDIQINPDASCVVMTTEILRSMLYRGADLIRDVEFIIFDEVHYVNDAERGVVWEEVIIMLPPHVVLILLSATVPNTKEFAGWVGRSKKNDIYVISTLKRPVPLEHHLFIGKWMHKIVENGTWLAKGYRDAYEIANPPPKIVKKKDDNNAKAVNRQNQPRQKMRVPEQRASKNNSSSSSTMFNTIINFLRTRDLLPVIIFAFSKQKCESLSQALSHADLTSGVEKSKILTFINQSLTCLLGSDKEIPQVLRTKELLSRGIAVHHSGLLPILKEIVEILFTKGLIKVLFATETFAMGVNAPARTVVFAMLRKHDGTEFRSLLPGEYTQMSGRAGRRGLDSSGVVIIACEDAVPNEHELRTLILGRPTKLESQFRVTYNMILNLLRVEAIRVEDMIKRSFSENDTQKKLPQQEELKAEYKKILGKVERFECPLCVDIKNYYACSSRILTLTYVMNEKIIRHAIGIKALSVGRLVVVNNQMYRNNLGIILGKFSGNSEMENAYWVFILKDQHEANGKT